MADFRNMRIAVSPSASVEVQAKLIAQEDSKRSGADRWVELRVYLTSDKYYIVQIRGESEVPGEKTRLSTAFVNDQKMLEKFLGTGRLALKLLSTLNIKP